MLWVWEPVPGSFAALPLLHLPLSQLGSYLFFLKIDQMPVGLRQRSGLSDYSLALEWLELWRCRPNLGNRLKQIKIQTQSLNQPLPQTSHLSLFNPFHCPQLSLSPPPAVDRSFPALSPRSSRFQLTFSLFQIQCPLCHPW